MNGGSDGAGILGWGAPANKEKEMEAALQTIYDEENAPTAYQLYKLAQKVGHAYTKNRWMSS